MSQSKSSLSSPLATIRPQPVTALQITEMYHLLGTALCKREIPSHLMERVLTRHSDMLSLHFVSLVDECIEIITGIKRSRVKKVDRTQTAQEAINAINARGISTGRFLSILVPLAVLEAAPKNECASAKKLHFFSMGREAHNDEVYAQYEKLKLRPADIWEMCAFNAKNPNFAFKYPNAVHFQDGDGKWWYVASGVGDGDEGLPFVTVSYVIRHWEDGWWFMGLPIEPEE